MVDIFKKPPPNRHKDSTQPIPIIISDADDLQNQNPIPPPSHDTYRATTQPSEWHSSFITTGKNAPHYWNLNDPNTICVGTT